MKTFIKSISGKRVISALMTLLCFCCICLVCGGCVSSYLVEKWQDTPVQSPLSKMLVIYITKNAAQRRIWEDAFTGALAKHTLSAVSSYGFFPSAPPDTNQVIEVAKTNGFNGIVVILTGKPISNMLYIKEDTTIEQTVHEIRQRERNGILSNEMQHLEQYSYWQRYSTSCRQIEYPGYSDSSTFDQHTIDVTTIGKITQLIWSATSRTPDSVSDSYVQGDIAGLVINELLQQHIIGFEK